MEVAVTTEPFFFLFLDFVFRPLIGKRKKGEVFYGRM